MGTQNQLKGIRFDGIEPGTYRAEPPEDPFAKLGVPHLRRARSVAHDYSPTRGGSSRGSKSFATPDLLSLTAVTRGDAASDVPDADDEKVMAVDERDEPKKTASKAAVTSKKPDDILKLEEVLAKAYRSAEPVRITQVTELPPTRKESVREVHFYVNHRVYKIWVFKVDDPKEIVRELNIDWIASEAEIPTARPICYEPIPVGQPYTYEIALLGGILEHAGGSYADLIGKLRWEPQLADEAARAVAGLIAEFHIKLANAEEEFQRLNVDIPELDVHHEIETRFLAGIGVPVQDEHGRRLVAAFEELYRKVKSESKLAIISHNDLHTGNLVTVEADSYVGTGTCTNRFGFIDLRDIARDQTPYNDLWNYWVHHKRIARAVFGEDYEPSFAVAESGYQERFNQLGAGLGWSFDASACQEHSAVMAAFWNLNKMYDPKRRDGIEEKAQIHCRDLMQNLAELLRYGYVEERNAAYVALQHLLKDREYLRPILSL